MKKKLDRLISHREAKQKSLYRKLHQTAEDAATQMQLSLLEPRVMPAFKRMRRRGPQAWLGE